MMLMQRIRNENVFLWISGYCALPLLFVIVAALALSSCSGVQRTPPIEVWDDMRRQERFKPQEETAVFADHRASRMPVAGTISRGHLKAQDAYHTGMENGQYIGKMPVTVTPELMRTGQTKFNTYCSPCHGRDATGVGIVPTRWPAWQPSNLQEDRLKQTADGDIFTVITYGRRSMPAYRYQIVESDRWAIVAYLRALQRSTSGKIEDVPQELRADLH